MNSESWLGEIGAAADDLGYGILEIRPAVIVLESQRSKGKKPLRVQIDSIFLSGALLKEVLAGNPETESER